MGAYRTLFRPLLFRFDPEWIHDRTMQAGHLFGSIGAVRAVMSAVYGFADPRLETEVCGIQFSNPLGLAAGFDKSGRAIQALAALGFGHLEIGSISADSSVGNPKPRLWRLPMDRAIVVHYGLPNNGAEAVARELAHKPLPIPLGINIVKTNRGLDAPPDPDDEIIADYVRSVDTLKGCGDYLVLNLSCPNTEMGRDFFSDHRNTVRLLTALAELDIRCPLFLKISPLGGVHAIEELLAAADGFDFVSGFVFNLAPGKPDNLKTPTRVTDPLPGATSGKPIEKQMNDRIRQMYRWMDRKRYRIIGIGGVFSAEDAYLKIRLGSSLVQLMTALVYDGPAVVKRINRGLCELLERDGFANVTEAVGTGNAV